MKKSSTVKRTRKSATQKAIEKRGWKVTVFKNSVQASKKGITMKADTMSDIRFLIRFEKFYRQQGKYAPVQKKA